MTPHVADALDRELAAPRGPSPAPSHVGTLLEAAAFGGASSLLITAANTALPFAGAALGGAVVGGVTYELARRRVPAVKEEVRADVVDAVDEVLRSHHLVPPPNKLGCKSTSSACRAWNGWLPWPDLADGAEVPVPADLPHPANAGFRRTRLAASRGQVADWVRSLPDGSRLHVHEYAGPGGSGRLSVHRDKLDPSRDPATAAIHWFTECSEGRALSVGVLGGLVTFLAVSAVMG